MPQFIIKLTIKASSLNYKIAMTSECRSSNQLQIVQCRLPLFIVANYSTVYECAYWLSLAIVVERKTTLASNYQQSAPLAKLKLFL